jgi:two-component system, NarL family, invasion response regulator UvrY
VKLRLIVAEDHPAFLQELVSALGKDFDVVATANDGRSALESARRYHPDVAVLDLSMPLLNGIEVARELAKDSVRPSVVICSIEREPEIVEAALEAGVLGYVFKQNIGKDLIAAVRAAAQGETFVSQP